LCFSVNELSDVDTELEDSLFSHNDQDQSIIMKVRCDVSTQANLLDDRLNNVKNEEDRSIADILAENSSTTDKTTQVNFLSNCDKSSGASKKCQKITLVHLLNTNEKLYTFTGIHSLDLFEGLVECVADIDVDAHTNKKYCHSETEF